MKGLQIPTILYNALFPDEIVLSNKNIINAPPTEEQLEEERDIEKSDLLYPLTKKHQNFYERIYNSFKLNLNVTTTGRIGAEKDRMSQHDLIILDRKRKRESEDIQKQMVDDAVGAIKQIKKNPNKSKLYAAIYEKQKIWEKDEQKRKCEKLEAIKSITLEEEEENVREMKAAQLLIKQQKSSRLQQLDTQCYQQEIKEPV
jgi:hypothetical protein